jgi:tRNA(His) 5'-end guanylyltransferase
MATFAFNRFFKMEMNVFKAGHSIFDTNEWAYPEAGALYGAYILSASKGAMFDARCFNIPKEEVCNCIYWRQLDATRNSIQMVGQANFSHAELQGKSCNDIQDMLHEQRGINWNDFPTRWKRGVAWTKTNGTDYEMPILRGEDRKYVDDEVWFVEEE